MWLCNVAWRCMLLSGCVVCGLYCGNVSCCVALYCGVALHVIWLCGLWTVMWQCELLRGFVLWRGVACCYLAVWFVDCNVAM